MTGAANAADLPLMHARIFPGMNADLVVLDGDPSKDITAFARVRLTVRGGRTIYDAKARPNNASMMQRPPP